MFGLEVEARNNPPTSDSLLIYFPSCLSQETSKWPLWSVKLPPITVLPV